MRYLSSFVASFLVLWSPAAFGQELREPVEVTGELEPTLSAEIASEHDLTVVFWKDVEERLYLSVSDGRGIEWSEPLRVDGDTGGASKVQLQAVIARDLVHLFWEDQREFPTGPAKTLFHNSWSPATGEFVGERPLLFGFAPGEIAVAATTATVVVVSGQEWIEIATRVDTDPTSFQGERIWSLRSFDGGKTFEEPEVLTPHRTLSQGLFLGTSGGHVHLSWIQRDPPWFDTWNLFTTRRVADGSWVPPVQLNASSPWVDLVWSYGVQFVGDTITYSWKSQSYDGEFWSQFHDGTTFEARVSRDAGETWGPTLVAAEEGIWAGSIHVAAETDRVVFARDEVDVPFDDGSEAILVSEDGGASFVEVLDQPGMRSFLVPPQAAHLLDRLWLVRYVGEPTPPLEWLASEDGGLTWSEPALLAPAAWSGPRAYNALYENQLLTWRDEEDLWVGGFRPQELSIEGGRAGETELSFAVDGFDSAVDSDVWILASSAPGSTLLPGGRDLGLASGALLGQSLRLAAAGDWAIQVGSDGSGASEPVSLDLPAGTTTWFVAVGIDRNGPAPRIGHITDVVRLDT